MLRYVVLGLLGAEPRYGYELKAVFEAFLGGTWPLNIGQVYTTLTRLERDGLVVAEVVPQDQTPDRKVYALTDAGRAELDAWLAAVEIGPVRLRDEFFLRIAPPFLHVRLAKPFAEQGKVFRLHGQEADLSRVTLH